MFMHSIRNYLSSLSLIIALLLPAQPAWSDSAQIHLKNNSSFDVMMQIKDEVCKVPIEVECGDARIFLQSQECQQEPISNACKAARATMDSACTCELARKTLAGEECHKTPGLLKCKEARDKLESASCIEGVIFEGTVNAGTTITLSICLSPSGYGSISVRDIRNSYWKSYRLISPGDKVSYP